MLTNDGGSGNLTKLSARAAAGPKKSTTFEKRVLTNGKSYGNIELFRDWDVYLVN